MKVAGPYGSNQASTVDLTMPPASAETLPDTGAAIDPLLTRCLEGDRRAWRELHQVHYPIAVAFLRKLGIRDHEAEDACQEVFVQVLRYLPTFEGRSSFKTWLYKLCVTQAERLRRRRRLLAALTAWAQQEQAAAPVGQGPDLSDAEARRRVQSALDRMKPHHRLVFVLFEMEGVPGKEIAVIADCPEATVWRRLHDARKEFAALIEEGPNARR